MKALIIDDERLAREELKHLLKEHKDKITIVGEASDGELGIQAIKEHQPDVVFLDIQMPEMDGLEMLKKLDEIPQVIFTSAYDEYALEAFKVDALDYLQKPIDPTLLKTAIDKVIEEKENEFSSSIITTRDNRKLTINDPIFIKDGEKCFFSYLKNVMYLESQGNYVRVYCKDQRTMILRSLNALENRLFSEDFFRANRKYIINIHHIENIENWFNGGLKVILSNDKEIEISRRQAIRFKEIMTL